MRERYVLGVDVGGTKIDICKADGNGDCADIRRYESNFSAGRDVVLQSILDAIDRYFHDVCAGAGLPLCIGLGLKDCVDSRTGVWLTCPAIPGFSSTPITQIVEERFQVPVVADNDVRVAVLAEKAYGEGGKYSDFIYFNIGTGISAGIIADGRLINGGSNYAGEIGHMSVNSAGSKCPYCGQNGCLEEIAGGGAIIQAAKEGLITHPYSELARLESQGQLYSRTIFQAADNGDELAGKIAQDVYRAVLVATLALVHIFNPQAVIFGGGVMSDGWILNKLKQEVPVHLLQSTAEGLQKLALSPIGSDHVGVFGAAVLGWEYISGRGAGGRLGGESVG